MLIFGLRIFKFYGFTALLINKKPPACLADGFFKDI
jgi:hypothetical protein